MMPGFFGERSAQCFRVYHAPTGAVNRPRAVLLCNPGPQEYRHCHWVYKQLAVRLADAGIHVMRFDYFGTGDSAGAASEASLDRWVRDIADAADELRALSGVSRLSAVGMRLGAALATRAVAQGLRVHDLILWDPVVHGDAYYGHLAAMHEHIRLDQAYPISDHNDPDELLGIHCDAAQREALKSLDLLAEDIGAPSRVWTVVAEPDAAAQALTARWEATGRPSSYEVIPDATLMRRVRNEDTLLAHAIPTAIVARLTGGAA
ncbi:MAG: alpha/beta fold hydrolase [Gemmatimonadaceae bacterium]|nr:alpha/beta fold hydrolase [Gemmatimonadaceae bacterium]